MPQPRFVTSDSQMIAPGVYIKENAPAAPIRGQRNRYAGFGGQCVRGPVDTLVRVDSYARFLEVFGGRDKNTNGGAILGHIWKALQGKRFGPLAIVRTAAAAAVAASFTLESAAAGGGTELLRVDASSVGTWGNDVGVKVSAATNADANYFNLSAKLYGKITLFENIIITTGNDNTNLIIGSDYGTIIRLTKIASGRPVNTAAGVDGADTDAFVNLGESVAGFTSVAGADGVIADTDYTAAGKSIEILNGALGYQAVAIVGRSNAAIKAAIETAAATCNQRVWYVCPDDKTVTRTAAIAERATFAEQRMSYWFNHVYITDPITKEEVDEEPFILPMSIVTQTDPDIHVGDFDNVVLTKSARRVHAELDDTMRDALTTGGVSFMLHDQDQNANDVIVPGNAVTCDFAVNNRELDGRYMKDFIVWAVAQRLRGDQFKGNTPANRAARASAVCTFLADLARKDRYIVRDEQGIPQFQYVNDASVNTVDEQADGLQRELLIARLIPKNIKIQLMATIGVDATISEQ